MKRTLLALVALVIVATAVLVSRIADATTCTLSESLQPVAPASYVLSWANKVVCYINLLRQRAIATPPVDVFVRSVTVPKGQRVPVTLTTAHALVGTEIITFSLRDPTSPPRLTVDGPSVAAGNTVIVHAWNHDPNTDRTGTLNLQITRP